MQINIALVGLGFGGSFAAIYDQHPSISQVGLFDINSELTTSFAGKLAKAKAYSSFEEVLADPDVDAVHLVTPIPLHAEQTVQVLQAGKHCACTVPMATSLEDIERIATAVRVSGKKYMMMETTLYTYQYLYVSDLKRKGELGRIQFLRGSHYQDMSGWPDYWAGLPPMHYGTHAIAPLVALADSRICRVVCFGSGTMEPKLMERYGNPYPVESALFEFENGLKAEATRTLFETVRAYQEGMFVYGSEMSFEWGHGDDDDPYVTKQLPAEEGRRGRRTACEAISLPNPYHSLPPELQHFTVGRNYDPQNPQESLKIGAGAGHHGSHPHLVHNFVKSIIEEEIHTFHMQYAFAYVNARIKESNFWATFRINDKITCSPQTIEKGNFSYTFDAIHRNDEKAVLVKVFADPLENCKKDELDKIKRAAMLANNYYDSHVFLFTKRRFSDYAAKQAPIDDAISFVEVERLKY